MITLRDGLIIEETRLERGAGATAAPIARRAGQIRVVEALRFD